MDAKAYNTLWGQHLDRLVLYGATLNGTTFGLYVYVPNIDATYARALEAGGTSVMAPADAFYGDRTGSVKDPFGHIWTLATHVEDVSPKEMAKRSKEAMEKMMASKPPTA